MTFQEAGASDARGSEVFTFCSDMVLPLARVAFLLVVVRQQLRPPLCLTGPLVLAPSYCLLLSGLFSLTMVRAANLPCFIARKPSQVSALENQQLQLYEREEEDQEEKEKKKHWSSLNNGETKVHFNSDNSAQQNALSGSSYSQSKHRFREQSPKSVR